MKISHNGSNKSIVRIQNFEYYSFQKIRENKKKTEDGNGTRDNTRFIYFLYEWLGVKVNKQISKKSINENMEEKK